MDLIRKATFSAAHHYRLPGLAPEEALRVFGQGAATLAHGHDYVLEATVRGETDPATGMVMNVKVLKDLMAERVVSAVGGRLLNEEVPELRGLPPTLETLARWAWSRLAPVIPAGRLHRIRLAETPEMFIEYSGEGEPGMLLTRVYDFSASHRLHSNRLSAEENRRVFGKCNNPNGHGHNYVLEVAVTGPVDERTGTLAGLDEIDAVVDREVLGPFDHQHLNHDVPEFAEMNPTAENIAVVIWRRLAGKLSRGRVARVRVVETPRNAVEYWGD